MAHLLRFIRPGAQRVDATYSLGNNLYMAAFQSGGKLVIVVLNQGGASKQSISIKGGSVSSLTAYVCKIDAFSFLNLLTSITC